MKVLGIACITNMATGIAEKKHTHEEVVRIANESSLNLCAWVKTDPCGLAGIKERVSVFD